MDVPVGEVGRCLGEMAELVFPCLQQANLPLCCPGLTGCQFRSAWGEEEDCAVIGQQS